MFLYGLAYYVNAYGDAHGMHYPCLWANGRRGNLGYRGNLGCRGNLDR